MDTLMKHRIIHIMLLVAVVLMASCGKDRQDDIDKLNALHTGIEGRVSKLETQVATLNTQLSQISVLAAAVEQGFYITQVKATADGYELTLSNGRVVVLQTTPGGMLTPVPAISMTQINGFHFWTVNGIVLTGDDGLPIRASGTTPVVRYDYTLNQWVISIDGGATFRDINEYVTIIINDELLMQVINNYLRRHHTSIFSQQVLFLIISNYIQQNYKELFSIDLLNRVVADYIREHHTRIFSYELLDQIFTQYNFSYIRDNIKVEELVDVILQFIRDHKEVFVDNDVLLAIITNYIEANKTTIFTNELLLEVINNFIQNNENYIDVELLTLVVSNYIDEHTDVVFNTETIRTLLTRYAEKWYVQIFSQDILIRLVSTYVTEHGETIFNRELIEEVINNYVQNNWTTIITHNQLVEIVNNYLEANSTTVFNRELLVKIITDYFEKNYSLYIKREDIITAINTYLSTHETTIISVEIISEVVNNYLKSYYKEVFTADLLKQVIVEYFRQHKEEISVEFSHGLAPITDVVVNGDVCVVTLSDGQTVQLQVYGAGSALSNCVQSLVVLPDSAGRIDVEGSSVHLRYLVSPASMALVIASDAHITKELVTTDGAGNLSRIHVTDASATFDGILSLSASIGEKAKAVALHVKDERAAATDIMTEFTPVGAENKTHGYLQCPDDHHPHMIDLGLPSGTLWSCCNVGASHPSSSGDYYAWGETNPKSNYTESSYEYSTKMQGLTAYMAIGSDIAGTQYDVASVKWGNQWRMPSMEQMSELVNNTTQAVSFQWNIRGVTFKGTNGGTIFLPVTGYFIQSQLYGKYDSYIGAYWSSTQDHDYYWCADILRFNCNVPYGTTDVTVSVGSDAHLGLRYEGLVVRPVAKP